MPRAFPMTAALTGLTLAVAPLSAQFGYVNPRPGPQETVAIQHAHIFPASGPDITNGTVVISGGKITAVGANVTVPNGARIIDATGLSVYPGMTDAGTQLGLSEIAEGANATVDVAEVGNFNPNVQAFYGIDPHSAHIGVTRVVGITSAVTSPSSGVLSGQAAFINLAGDTPPRMAVVAQLAQVINLPGGGGGRGGGGFGGRGGGAGGNTNAQLDSLKQLLQNADAYGKAMDAYAKDKTLPRPSTDVVLASLLPLIRGEMPAIFNAESSTQIKDAVNFAEEMHLKPIIMGGRDAVKVADFLKQHDVPVIFKHVLTLPAGGDDVPYDDMYAAPAKLDSAGVRFAIASGEENPDVRNLPYNAGMAAAFGLSKADALKAVTLWPAQIFGLGDKLGSIEVGKMANLVVTDGDLLEAYTNTRYLFIDGRAVSLENKQVDLYNAFKDRHE